MRVPQWSSFHPPCADDALASAERYLSIINNQQDLVCRYATDLTLTFVNDAFCRFFGQSRDELIGMPLLALFPTVKQDEFGQRLARLTTETPDVLTERPAVAHNGADRWQQWCDRAVFDSAGRIVEYQAVGRDITTRKYLGDHLREREERYHAIVSNVAMGICLVDAYGQFLECNPAFVQMTGYIPEELVMLTLSQVTFPADWEQEQEHFLPLWDGNSTGYSLEKRLITKSCTPVWTLAMTTLIHGPAGEPQYAVQLLEDISVRKEAERMRGEYEEKLRALTLNATLAEERERRRIAQNLHDQIGQSLAIARMQLGKISIALGASDAPLHQDIEDTRTLLSEALDYSRTVTSELSPPILHELGLVPALRWLAKHFSDRYHLPTRLAAEGALPVLTQEARVVLYHTARELLFNIVKHAHASHGQLVVRHEGEAVMLTVTDDGNGFPQSVSATGSEGFGLFSVRERVGQLGGSLVIETGTTRGTRCLVRVPVSAVTKTQEYHR
ncbi:MAG TPA: PAS domain S-box protein [Armatimonadota bacterium]